MNEIESENAQLKVANQTLRTKIAELEKTKSSANPLEGRVAALESENAALRARLSALEPKPKPAPKPVVEEGVNFLFHAAHEFHNADGW